MMVYFNYCCISINNRLLAVKIYSSSVVSAAENFDLNHIPLTLDIQRAMTLRHSHV